MSSPKKKLSSTQMKTVKAGRGVTLTNFEAKKNSNRSTFVGTKGQ